MKYKASKLLKWLYCLTLIVSIFPSGLYGSTGWTSLATGGGLLRASLLFLLLWVAIFVYRIVIVTRHESTLDAFVTSKLIKLLRLFSVFLMVVGLIGSLAMFFIKPLTLHAFGGAGDNGIGFFVMGFYLYFVSSVGLPGVMLFEVSRLLGFEQKLRGVNS